MRLWVLVPGRRGRAGLGRLTALLAVAAAGIAGCGGGTSPKDDARTGTAEPPVTTPAGGSRLPEERLGRGLAIGLTEGNAVLLRRSGVGTQVPGFEAGREQVSALAPHLYRLVVDWATLQPERGRPANLELPADGCARGAPPCATFAGLRDVLAALATHQDGGRFRVMVVFYGVPDWAAAAPGGCERPGIGPRSRPLNDAGLGGYRALVRDVGALARREGVDIRWWSVWNEPNGPFFISPQRPRCSADSTPVSPKVYTRMARALKTELERMPGEQELVVGEMAGIAKAGRYGTGAGQFLRALPDDVLCSAAVVAQHAYATLPGARTAPGDPVAEVERALDARPCAADTPVWITETGVGGPHAGDVRPTGAVSLARQCAALHRQLEAWFEDPRIQAAFQYTFREDRSFPVGLVDPGLTRTYPTLALLQAWAGDREPADAAPTATPGCTTA